MKTRIILAAFVVILAMGSAFSAEYKTPDQALAINASVIEFSTNSVVAKGNVSLTAEDKANKSLFTTNCGELRVTFFTGTKNLTGIDLIKTADFIGTVKIFYNAVDKDGVATKSTAIADKGSYTGKDKMLRLIGNVKITNENPAMFKLPAVATGDKASVNLSPILSEDNPRFRIESSSEPSKIEIFPVKK